MGIALNLNDVLARPYAYEGFDHLRKGWLIPRPLQPHDHYRDPDEPTEADVFNMVVPISASIYRWSVAMPNLGKNRIRTAEQAHNYREKILACARPVFERYDVLVPFYVEEGLDLVGLERSFAARELLAGKMYAKNATTHSSWGVDFRYMERLYPLFAIMERHDIVLQVHAEVVHYIDGRLIEDRLREQMAIHIINAILEAFPQLRVVFEHVSSRHSVSAVKRWQRLGYRIEATVAPQYLIWNQTVLFEGGMNPVKFSIPILKDHRDQMALIKFVIEGGGMIGQDSAPWNIWKKAQASGCPGGVFNAPVGIHVYFHIFRKYGRKGWFKRFVDFACRKPARFYRLPSTSDQVLITEEPWTVQDVYQNPGAEVLTAIIPMLAGDEIPTTLRAA